MVTPMPTAGPFTAAMTGLTDSKIRSEDGAAAVAVPGALGVVERGPAAGEVGTGAEPAPRAGEHDGPDPVVGVGAVEGVDQLAGHPAGERVEPVRPVQGDRRDPVADPVADLLVPGVRVGARHGGQAFGPPAAYTTCPDTNPACSLTRNDTSAAMSSG
jgi:hypothetical protein